MDISPYPTLQVLQDLQTAVQGAETAENMANATQSAENAPTATVPLSQIALLADTLQLYGYKTNPENVQMLLHMLDKGLPLTKENIAAMHQALKMTSSLERAAFLLQNNLPVSPKNAHMITNLSEGTAKISTQLDNLFNSISQLKDTTLQQTLLKIFDSLGQQKNADNANSTNTTNSTNNPNNSQNLQNTQNTQTLPNVQTPPNPQNVQTSQNTQNLPNVPTSQNTPNLQNIPTSQNTTNSTTAQTATSNPPQPPTFTAVPVVINRQPISVISATIADKAAHIPETTQPVANPQNLLQNPLLHRPANINVVNLNNLANSQQTEPLSQPQTTVNTSQTSSQVSQLSQLSETVQTSQTSQTQPPQTAEPLPLQPQTNLDISNIRKKFSFDWQNGSVNDLERFVNEMREILERATAATNNSPNAQNSISATRVLQDLQTLSEYIDFSAQIRNQTFVQVPVVVNDQIYNTALYTNKDKTQKKTNNNVQTALIALDTAFLGHFETYLKKDNNNLQLQFRLETPKIENLVRENIHKLSSALKDHQYILESFNFVVNDKPFTILDNLDDKKQSLNHPNTLFDATA
ncbi:MAG: flagellar hook-length control protein FliK [Firmicutes bacterium]|nr:flagellar hook-length control protein FliK [Bacillota bacterium]